jgi:hypothetical protein
MLSLAAPCVTFLAASKYLKMAMVVMMRKEGEKKDRCFFEDDVDAWGGNLKFGGSKISDKRRLLALPQVSWQQSK